MKIDKDKLLTLLFLFKLNLMEAWVVFIDKMWYYGLPISMVVLAATGHLEQAIIAAIAWLVFEAVVLTIEDYKDK